jgi:hypothetical protein
VKGDLRLPVVLAALAMLLRDFGLSLLAIAALAALLHWTMPRHRPIDRLPVALLAAALTVGVAWLAWRAAGPDGLARAGLGDAPFSPAAQRIMAAALLLVGVILAGVPPFDRFVPGALLAPLAASLIGGAVLPGMPEGVEQWRGIVAPWLVVAAADAVRRRREALAAACAALFVIVAGDPGAATTGLLLAVAASAAELVPMVAWPSWRPWAARVLAALAVASFAGGLRQALGGEVVYSVAMTAVLLAGVLRGGTGATVAPPRETAQ